MEVVQKLFTQSPFKDLEKNELEKIVNTLRVKKFPEGTRLIEQDKMVHQFGFIKSGSASLVVRDIDDSEITCGSLNKGDFFGEMSVFADGTSPISIVCAEPVTGYIRSREDFFHMIKTYPNLKDFFCQSALNRMLNVFQIINVSKAEFRLRTIGLPRVPQGIRKSLLYIDKNYMEPLTLDEVARESGVSKYHFSRVFKAETGRSFSGHLNRKRIEVAKSLMEYHDMNITEACFAVGFNDLSYFSRVFRKLEGITPSVYLRDLRIDRQKRFG
ncbi:MAG: helix-turn-helix domain-containing protein [Deltaproteobacteria bacterium]|nr:helix-turn-helix domain-containing protein [Candidatus Tharpellaceae bacterium]